jgi:hypothetical protein
VGVSYNRNMCPDKGKKASPILETAVNNLERQIEIPSTDSNL